MNQSATVYDMRSAVESLEPWLEQHLPNLDPVARRRFTHLITGEEQKTLAFIHFTLEQSSRYAAYISD